MVITLGISIKFKNFVALTNSIRIVFFFPIIIKFKTQIKKKKLKFKTTHLNSIKKPSKLHINHYN